MNPLIISYIHYQAHGTGEVPRCPCFNTVMNRIPTRACHHSRFAVSVLCSALDQCTDFWTGRRHTGHYTVPPALNALHRRVPVLTDVLSFLAPTRGAGYMTYLMAFLSTKLNRLPSLCSLSRPSHAVPICQSIYVLSPPRRSLFLLPSLFAPVHVYLLGEKCDSTNAIRSCSKSLTKSMRRACCRVRSSTPDVSVQ